MAESPIYDYGTFPVVIHCICDNCVLIGTLESHMLLFVEVFPTAHLSVSNMK